MAAHPTTPIADEWLGAAMLYSSGTTGRPKGIVRALWLSADEIRASAPMHRSPLLLTSLEDYLAGRRFPLDVITTDPSILLQK